MPSTPALPAHLNLDSSPDGHSASAHTQTTGTAADAIDLSSDDDEDDSDYAYPTRRPADAVTLSSNDDEDDADLRRALGREQSDDDLIIVSEGPGSRAGSAQPRVGAQPSGGRGESRWVGKARMSGGRSCRVRR